jgi:hypothetical protein
MNVWDFLTALIIILLCAWEIGREQRLRALEAEKKELIKRIVIGQLFTKKEDNGKSTTK